MPKRFPGTDPETRLLKFSRSGNLRDIERFPIVLLGRMRNARINTKWLLRVARANQERTRLRELLALSRLLYEANDLDLPELNDLPEAHQVLRDRFSKGGPVLMGHGRPINAFRLKKYFGEHLGASTAGIQKRSRQEYLLSLVLSPRQREIVRKREAGEKQTKSEIEYFSRTIKDKLTAILDPDVRNFAVRGLS